MYFLKFNRELQKKERESWETFPLRNRRTHQDAIPPRDYICFSVIVTNFWVIPFN